MAARTSVSVQSERLSPPSRRRSAVWLHAYGLNKLISVARLLCLIAVGVGLADGQAVGTVTTVAGVAGIAGSTNGVGPAAKFFFPVGGAIDAAVAVAIVVS